MHVGKTKTRRCLKSERREAVTFLQGLLRLKACKEKYDKESYFCIRPRDG
jgi:hypothetical protein